MFTVICMCACLRVCVCARELNAPFTDHISMFRKNSKILLLCHVGIIYYRHYKYIIIVLYLLYVPILLIIPAWVTQQFLEEQFFFIQ